MLKLKLHYFGHLMQRNDSFEKTLMLGKIDPNSVCSTMTAQCKYPSINLLGTQMVQKKAMTPHCSTLAWKIP